MNLSAASAWDMIAQAGLLAIGLLCAIKPQWLVGAVYAPARIKRLRWIELFLVLLGIYIALVSFGTLWIMLRRAS
jgi:amino acid permease